MAYYRRDLLLQQILRYIVSHFQFFFFYTRTYTGTLQCSRYQCDNFARRLRKLNTPRDFNRLKHAWLAYVKCTTVMLYNTLRKIYRTSIICIPDYKKKKLLLVICRSFRIYYVFFFFNRFRTWTVVWRNRLPIKVE